MVGVTDLTDAGMELSAEISDIGNVDVTTLADAALMEDRDVDFHCDNPKLTAFGCRRGTSTRNDLHDQLVASAL